MYSFVFKISEKVVYKSGSNFLGFKLGDHFEVSDKVLSTPAQRRDSREANLSFLHKLTVLA